MELNPEVEVSKASPRNLEDIYEIELASFKDPYPLNLLKAILEENPDGCFIAKHRGRVVGYVAASISAKVAHVISVAVKPENRGRGIGEKLLGRLLEELKYKGITMIFLEVRVSNKAAINLYRKLGFRESRRIPRYYLDREDCIMFMKKLPLS